MSATDIARARELLEQHGLGHLRPDKAWRPRSWRDRLAAIPYPEEMLVEEIARAIYMTHWDPGPDTERSLGPRMMPTWENASDSVQEWVRAQARSVLARLLSIERGTK